MIYLVIVVFVLHTISLPLVISVVADVDTDADHAKITVRFMFVPVFIKNIDVKAIKSKLNSAYRYDDTVENEKQEQSSGTNAPTMNGKLKKFSVALAMRILGRIRVRALECTAKIGTGDAAASAMTAGSIKIAFLQACAFFGFDGKNIQITPDYNDECLFLDFFGIISLCFADIIFAICTILFDIGRKRAGKRSYYANTATE